MPPINPAQPLLTAPIQELVVLLLKQFKRLLQECGVELTTPLIEAIGQAVANAAPVPEEGKPLVAALQALVAESLAVLQDQFQLSFEQALNTDMNALGGWETTAEFLDIANQKSNAELRISGGATLRLLLGDESAARLCLVVIAADQGLNDVDAMLARRALCHFTQVDPQATNWLAQIQKALEIGFQD